MWQKGYHTLRYICYFVCLWALGAFGLAACQIPNPEGGGTQPGLDPEKVIQITQGIEALSEDVQTFVKPSKVEAWVDQLIIKAQPGKDMPEIGKMKEGEIATYLYQRTVEQTEYKLRGQRFHEPWILIKTQQGQMGWVHEGGVRYVNPGFQHVVEEVLGPPPGSPNARVIPGAVADPASLRQVVPGKQIGAIKLKTSEADLIQLYGASQVGRSVVRNADGKELPCTVVFPRSREELRIVWKNEARTQIKEVYIEQVDSPWFTQEGLGVGVPLIELTKANKAPVNFEGFAGNYGGVVLNWRQGTLQPYANYCYVVLAPQTQAENLSRFQNTETFSSNVSGIDKLNVRVSRWVVYLN